MRFVRKVVEGTQKSFIYLDIGNMTLPGSGHLSKENIDRLLTFPADTFKLLKQQPVAVQWDVVFGTVHKFLDTLTETEQQKFVILLLVMHQNILQVLGAENTPDTEVVTLETKLSKLLAQFERETKLMPRLVDFAQENIPLQSFSGAGERPQDSPEMTFHRPDVIRLTAVALLCKMMTPIFGVFIYQYKNQIESSHKEMHCVAILKDTLYTSCYDIMEKVNNFISRIIKSAASEIAITHIYNGYTLSTIISTIYSQILTKRLIGVDFYKTSTNLVTYITSCARYAINSQFRANAFKNAVKEIRVSKDYGADYDEGNVSSLEVESVSSVKPADYLILIKAAARELLRSFPAEHELNLDLIKKAQEFYELNHVSLTPANEYLLGIVFGGELCGAKSIACLDGYTLAQLVPLMQAYLYQQGYYSLIPLVSLQQTGMTKSIPPGEDVMLKSMWSSSYEYKNCDSSYTYCVNALRWDTGLKALVDNITSELYKINLAPVFTKLLGWENLNGEAYVGSEKIPKEICALIKQLYP